MRTAPITTATIHLFMVLLPIDGLHINQTSGAEIDPGSPIGMVSSPV